MQVKHSRYVRRVNLHSLFTRATSQSPYKKTAVRNSMKVNWKVRFKFVKSLRFRILVILIIIGIVPSIIVEKGIVNSYEDRAVTDS